MHVNTCICRHEIDIYKTKYGKWNSYIRLVTGDFFHFAFVEFLNFLMYFGLCILKECKNIYNAFYSHRCKDIFEIHKIKYFHFKHLFIPT